MITKNEIMKIFLTGLSYNQIIEKYMPKNKYDQEERDELRSLIIYQLLTNTKNEDYLIKAWTNNQLTYLYAKIVHNQVTKTESSWNYTYKMRGKDYNQDFDYVQDNEDFEQRLKKETSEDEEYIYQLMIIKEAINYHLTISPRLRVEFDMLEKNKIFNMSYREIGKIYKSHPSTIGKYINRAKDLIKIYIINKENELRNII